MTLEADLLIEDCTILPMTKVGTIEKGCIAVRNGGICYIGRVATAPQIKADDVIQGGGKVAMPGLVNCHTHVAMTLFRGLAEGVPLETWLNETIWPLEAKLKPQDVYAGARLGCLEMIKSGTTCFADMYFFESSVAHAVRTAGLRAVLASGIIEAGDESRGEKMLQDAVEFATNYQGSGDGRVTTSLGPHTVHVQRRIATEGADESFRVRRRDSHSRC
jgi:5-methylthioadenosine/S-adenosylhomocysteine deaminase